jgi:hypothetical protein
MKALTAISTVFKVSILITVVTSAMTAIQSQAEPVAVAIKQAKYCDVQHRIIDGGRTLKVDDSRLDCIANMVYFDNTPYMVFNKNTCKFEYVACNLTVSE